MRVLAAMAALIAATLGAVPVRAADTAIDVNVDPDGQYTLHSHQPDWTFSGDIGQPLSNIRQSAGADALGAYTETAFDYAGGRTASIRTYASTQTVLFSSTYGGGGGDPFPALIPPRLPYSLSYRDVPFSPYQLNNLKGADDGPWMFFDGQGNAFMLSAADGFLNARLRLQANGSLASVVEPSPPAGYSQRTLLVIESGLNTLMSSYGAALQALHAKPPVANDADVVLKTLGYWTDNGATYYYHFEPSLGYAATLLAVVDELHRGGINIGYLQLDSWWYPKGAQARWDDRNGGIWQYLAAPALFPDGLAAFQQRVGLPLATHARWIDPTSPYRANLAFSGNVMTDRRYWDDVMTYLQSNGVVMYEQDWLGANAQPVYDLNAPVQFMGNMASSALSRGVNIQYCMPLPRHVLQSVEYSNVMTMRVSDDRFDPNRWDTFLYTSRLASAVGLWPWADVFMSGERDNLLLAALSGGIVGFGDALGAENARNLSHVARADGVLVKPDAPIVPTDDTVLSEAAGVAAPMVASTYSDHAGLRATYVFAYARGATSQQASYAVASDSYVDDVFAGAGTLVRAGSSYSAVVADGSYYVVAPVGPSGIAFLGDAGQWISLGRQRISALSDDGILRASVEFAAGERTLTLRGYAPMIPAATSTAGTIDRLDYDPSTGRFSVVLRAGSAPASVDLAIGLQDAVSSTTITAAMPTPPGAP